MAWQTPATSGVGVLKDEADLQQELGENMNALFNPPRVAVSRTTDQTISGFTRITWQVETVADTAGLWSAETPDRFIITVAGRYWVSLTAALRVEAAESVAIVYAAILDDDTDEHMAIEQYANALGGAFQFNLLCDTTRPFALNAEVSGWVFEVGDDVTLSGAGNSLMGAWWVGE